ncbi:MAG: molybdopterin-binding protein [Thermoplasmatales archaeon]
MRKIRTEDAEGLVLAYDTTIVTKTFSKTLFKKGHVIGKKDIPKLKDSGVYYLWVEDGLKKIDEEEISFKVAEKIKGDGLIVRKERHGMCSLFAERPGVVSLSLKNLRSINRKGIAMIISRKDGCAVGKGDLVSVVDSIPLTISDAKLKKFLASCRQVISLKNFERRNVGLVITGTEIYEGRKEDKYRAIIEEKCAKYSWKLVYTKVVRDRDNEIVSAVKEAVKKGADGIIITGGMSVDPTDRTPSAVKKLGARIISYGIPVKPTTMTIVAELGGIPIIAISAGGIHYSKLNSVDLIFTRMMAGEIPSRNYIAELGNGGLTEYYLSTLGIMRPTH